MRTQRVSIQSFEGRLVFIDKSGNIATGQTQRELISRLGTTVSQLRGLIAPKPFDLFISQKGADYTGVNANKTFRGVLRCDTEFRALHKTMLNNIIQTAKKSIEEYEKFTHK